MGVGNVRKTAFLPRRSPLGCGKSPPLHVPSAGRDPRGPVSPRPGVGVEQRLAPAIPLDLEPSLPPDTNPPPAQKRPGMDKYALIQISPGRWDLQERPSVGPGCRTGPEALLVSNSNPPPAQQVVQDGQAYSTPGPGGPPGPTGTTHVAWSLRDPEWAWNNALPRLFLPTSNRYPDPQGAFQSGGMDKVRMRVSERLAHVARSLRDREWAWNNALPRQLLSTRNPRCPRIPTRLPRRSGPGWTSLLEFRSRRAARTYKGPRRVSGASYFSTSF